MAGHVRLAPATPWGIPAVAGIGLRHPHVASFLKSPPRVGWIEVHSENYFGPGGPRLAALDAIRRDFPLSCHGVGLSLGSAEGLDLEHLGKLGRMIERYQPALVSEHLAWSVTGGIYLNDLLPLPYNEASLDIVCRNVDRTQDFLGRQILVENASAYLTVAGATMPEAAFLGEVVRRTGCGVLLDVNNIHVSATNCGLDPGKYLDAIPAAAVGEIHLAGHARRAIGNRPFLIDDHGSRVDPVVWHLFEQALNRFGPVPTLIEWDTRIPPIGVLLAEADAATVRLDQARRCQRPRAADAAG